MISNFLENINSINLFDIFVGIIFIYCVTQCFLKGFSLSLISFMKWVLSTIVTIILVPKLQPTVSEYIESEFINNVGLGVFIFVCVLFVTIVLGRALNRAVTWTGLGSIDKTFGLLFGFFKGYVMIVCLFTIFNWFYPYKNWGISVEQAVTYDVIKKGSELLIEEFPNSQDYIDTKEKIEKI